MHIKKFQLLVMALYGFSGIVCAQVTLSDEERAADQGTLYHLLSRSPRYSVAFSEYLGGGANNLEFKEFADKLLALPNTLAIIDAFQSGKIIWRKTDETWTVILVDPAYSDAFKNMSAALDALAAKS